MRGMIVTGEKPSTQQKNQFQCQSTTNVTCTGLGSNMGLGVEGLVTNQLSHC